MIWPSIALLAFVTLQRLVELPLAHANTNRLLAAGGP
jgi:methyltransferase